MSGCMPQSVLDPHNTKTYLLVIHQAELLHLDLVDEGAADAGQGHQRHRQPHYDGRSVAARSARGIIYN